MKDESFLRKYVWFFPPHSIPSSSFPFNIYRDKLNKNNAKTSGPGIINLIKKESKRAAWPPGTGFSNLKEGYTEDTSLLKKRL